MSMGRKQRVKASKDYASLIQAEMQRMGISQKELAIRADISPQYINQLINLTPRSKTNPTPRHVSEDMAIAIGNVFGWSEAESLVNAGYAPRDTSIIAIPRSGSPVILNRVGAAEIPTREELEVMLQGLRRELDRLSEFTEIVNQLQAIAHLLPSNQDGEAEKTETPKIVTTC